MDIDEFIDTEFLGNTYGNYIAFASVLLFGFFLRNVISKNVGKLSYRFFKRFSKDQLSKEFIELLSNPIKLFFGLLIIYVAFDQVNLPYSHLRVTAEAQKRWTSYIQKVYNFALILSITWIALRLVDFVMLVLKRKAELTESKADDQLVFFLKDFSKIVVLIFSVFSILGGVFKLNITSLIAGLGIGGLAIALAAQETLSNLLASFIIFLDKPFQAGDLVNVDNITGTIEKVGFRSTRIRTLDKSLLTVPNKKLVDNPLNNITLSPYRRVKTVVGLTYNTTPEQISKIVEEIRAYILSHKGTTDDTTVSFFDFRESTLEIVATYFVLTNDWDFLVEVRQDVNLKIMEIVKNNGSSFAFPTQTLHIEKNEGKLE